MMTAISDGLPLVSLAHLLATVATVFAIARITRDGSVSRRSTVLLVSWLIVLGCIGFLVSDPPYYFADFRSSYYPAGVAVLGHPGDLRPLSEMGVLGGFTSLPIVAYLFAPLGALRLRLAIGIFDLIGIASVVSAWFLLVRLAKLGLTERWWLALAFVSSGPMLYSLREGNLSHCILLALVAGLALLRSGRSGAAGMLLGVAAILKPPLILFAAYFGLRRDPRGTAGLAVVFASAVAASVLIFGWNDNVNWFETNVVRYSHHWLVAFNDQSLPSLLFRRQMGPERLLDWNAYLPPPGAQLTVQILTVFLFAIALLSCVRTKDAARCGRDDLADLRRDLQYLLLVTLILVSSPLAWSHYYVWLLMPAAFFLGWLRAASARSIAGFAAWAALCLGTPLILPLQFSNEVLMRAYWLFGLSHLLFSGLTWFCLLAWWLARSGGLLSPLTAATRTVGGNETMPDMIGV